MTTPESWDCVCGHDGLPEWWHADHCLRGGRDGDEQAERVIEAVLDWAWDPHEEPTPSEVARLREALAGPLADLVRQRDEAQAAVARVTALAEEWDAERGWSLLYGNRLRAALDGGEG